MKKKVLFGVLLATLALSGCNQNKSKDDSTAVDLGKQLNASQVAADVKAKYDDGQLDYTGEKLTVQRNEPIKLDIDFSPLDLGMKDFREVVEIYQDSNLTQGIGTHFNMDDDHTFIEVLPPRSAVAAVSQLEVNKKDYGYENGNLMLFEKDDNQDWGNLSEVYMAVKVDLETGEPLDKPLVTPIRIAHEITGDLRLKLSLTEEGTPEFSWNELEGADYYYLVDVDYKTDKGVAGQSFVREKITEGTSFEAEPGAQFTTFKVKEIDRQKEDVIKEYGEGTGPIQKEDDTEHRYAVVAVSEDGTSSMSNTLSLTDLAKRIPYAEEIGKSSEEEGSTTAAEMGLLPAYRWVTMSDGSLVQKLINYDTTKAKEDTELWGSYEKDDLSDLETHKVELITIPYTVEGTPFSGKAKVESYNAKTWKEDLEKIKERQDQLRNKAGNTQVEMTTEEVEEETTDTKKDTSESSSATKESSSSQSSKEQTTESSSTKRRRKTKTSESTTNESSATKSSSSESNSTSKESTTSSSKKESTRRRKKDSKETTSEATVSETNDKITANSALSEYLAINMLDGKTEIDIQDFPEALVQETLFESWMEAIYQNPLILGAEGAQIRDFGQTLKVTYNTKPEEMKKKQEELRKEVKKVVKEIIKEDMTDLEKEYAINAYLTEIAEYDNGALENAEKNNFEKVDAEFNDSFTPYGVLINKVGVCASYAGAFKLLADEAGLEAIVVTGYLEGDLPHAWNKVKIEDEWYILDVTNNDNEVMANALLNIPGNASTKVLVEDDRYVINSHLNDYKASDKDQESEYYHVEAKYFDEDKIVKELVTALKTDGEASLRTSYNLTDEQFYSIGSKVVEQTKDNDMQGTYWMGVIYLKSSK
ncbi:transglutaminase domain-containing protein [Enterococcus sp. LJL99]